MVKEGGVTLREKDKNPCIRQEILAKAKVLYAEKGFDGTSMRDIAQAASVNLSLIYYYFKNKEDLLVSILEVGFLRLHETLSKELDKSDDVIESIKNFVKVFMNHILTQNKHYFMIMQQEIFMRQGRFFRSVMAKYKDNSWIRLQNIIRKGVEAKILRPMDPKLAYFSLVGTMVYYAMSKSLILESLNKEDYDERFFNTLVQHITDSFLYGAIYQERGELINGSEYRRRK